MQMEAALMHERLQINTPTLLLQSPFFPRLTYNRISFIRLIKRLIENVKKLIKRLLHDTLDEFLDHCVMNLTTCYLIWLLEEHLLATDKPNLYRFRSWEIKAVPTIGCH